MFLMSKWEGMTSEILKELVSQHQNEKLPRLKTLNDMYLGNHEILFQSAKEIYKPDNRIVSNFSKYIVGTFNGYFIGIPVKVVHDNEATNEYIQALNNYNDYGDKNAELAKMSSIYGVAYELLYTDDFKNIVSALVSPEECFIVRDDTLAHDPMYAVHYYTNAKGDIVGSYFDNYNKYTFDKKYNITDEEAHGFGKIPVIEYVENEERQGLFEPVQSLINAYNKAVSEKANDVDYFADAYLKILGAILDQETLDELRDNRIINLEGIATDKLVVEFLEKPNADTTQENLINRFEKLIYHLSMVANINDENFGNSSGVALAYKLQSMSNLAMVKERKFSAALNRRYQTIATNPTSHISEEDWVGINYTFSRNIPNNLLEETQIAGNLAGITSKETQLKALSIVDNVQNEIKRIEEEKETTLDLFQTSAEKVIGDEE